MDGYGVGCGVALGGGRGIDGCVYGYVDGWGTGNGWGYGHLAGDGWGNGSGLGYGFSAGDGRSAPVW